MVRIFQKILDWTKLKNALNSQKFQNLQNTPEYKTITNKTKTQIKTVLTLKDSFLDL